MELNEQNLSDLTTQAVQAVFTHERDTALGYQGKATPLRAGMYFEATGEDGSIYVVDNEHLAATGKIALRHWVTISDDHLGGAESVTPGGAPKIGGIGIGSLLSLLGLATGNPALGLVSATTKQSIGTLILGFLQGKLARFGGSPK